MSGNSASRLAWAVLLTALLAPVALIGTAAPAWACSCMRSDVAEQVSRSDVVFSGHAVDVTPTADPSGADPVTTTFAVDAVFHGDVTAEEVVSTAASSAACGVEFTPGTAYLVYGVREAGAVSTTLCSGTAPLDTVPAADRDVLGTGTPVAADPPAGRLPADGTASAAGSPTGEPSTGGVPAGVVAAIVGGGVVVLVLAAALLRRRRRPE